MVTIIIVNWNSGDYLRRCVASIQRHGAGCITDVLIVDNGSVDGSDRVTDIAARREVEVIRNVSNVGFSAACNQGASFANSEYLLFLNPDAALGENTIDRALNYMNLPNNNDIGVLGVRLVDESGATSRHCARFPTPWHFAARSLGLHRLIPAADFFMSTWDHGETRDVDHVIGAFYLVRRSVFVHVGGFDTRFFVYMEDLDFSRRARTLGYRVTYLSEASVRHAGGGTSRNILARRLFLALRSQLQYAQKHFGLSGYAFTAGSTLVVEPLVRLAEAVVRGSATSAMQVVRAFFWLWGWWVLRSWRAGPSSSRVVEVR